MDDRARNAHRRVCVGRTAARHLYVSPPGPPRHRGLRLTRHPKAVGILEKHPLTTLVMYPIIMGFIGAGAAMAYLLGGRRVAGENLGLLAIVVYFAPYFLLPFAFKLAGGLMSTVFSIANDRGRGMFDRGRKKREGIREDRKTRADQNSLWDPNSKFQKAVGGNRFASAVIDPYGNLAHAGRRIPGLRKKGNMIESSINASRTEQTGKLFEELNNKYSFNDKAYRVLSGAHGKRGKDLDEETCTSLNSAAYSVSE